MAIESLMQQTGTFVDALTVKPAAVKTEAETAMEARVPDQGDTVTISEDGRALVAMEKPGESEDSGESDEETALDQTIKMLKEQIEQVKQEIEDLENSGMPNEMKEKQLQAKRNELAEYENALLKAMEEKMKGANAKEASGVTI